MRIYTTLFIILALTFLVAGTIVAVYGKHPSEGAILLALALGTSLIGLFSQIIDMLHTNE